ncbi:MAG TPA: low affinity iron permease family protein [Candidatus Saccharimonadales bacterium]|nr:low affinity iron permease family protein [Candidatus Saccharimonadales bacterium]
MKNVIHSISVNISQLAGSTWTFMLAILGVLVWIVTGPYYHFSNTWLVVISAITDVVIFVMVFSIQNTQNRDNKAVHLKLNELISADQKARNTFIGLEELTDEELGDIDNEFKSVLSEVGANHPLHKLHKRILNEKNARLKAE